MYNFILIPGINEYLSACVIAAQNSPTEKSFEFNDASRNYFIRNLYKQEMHDGVMKVCGLIM